MTSTGTQHRQAVPPGAPDRALAAVREVIEVRCRRRQGPYSGGRDLFQVIATELAQAARNG